MVTQAIIPQPTGNPIFDNPARKAAFIAAQGGVQQPLQPQGAIMPPAGQQPPAQISLPEAPMPSFAKPPVIFGPFGQKIGPVAQRGTQEGDEQERERLLSTGSGLSQIHSRIESAMPNHPVLGKVLGIGAQALGTIGDIGLRTVAPQIEQQIPGTEGHHQLQLNRVNTSLGQDIGNAEKEAQTGNLQEEGNLHEQQARAAELTPTTDEESAALGVPPGTMLNAASRAALARQGGINRTKVDTTTQTNETKAEIAKTNQIVGTDGVTYHVDPKTFVGTPILDGDGKPIIGAQKSVDIKKQLQNGVVAAMNSGNGPEAERLMTQLKAIDPLGWQNASSKSSIASSLASNADLNRKAFERDTFGTLFGRDIPSSLVDEAGNTLGWKSPSAPTASVKQQAQQSQDLVALSQGVRDEIAKAQANGSLGPYAGRISEIMTGKIGADDPQFAKLRTLGSMYITGAMKAHFGARGGQQMYDHFKALMDTGKMTEGDLLGAMSGFETFFGQYAKRVQSAGAAHAGGNQPAQGGAEHKIGDSVMLNGQKVTIKKIYPDGTFDY
jgi:hypothetical protein